MWHLARVAVGLLLAVSVCASAGGLSAQGAPGQAIFRTGTSPGGGEIFARVGIDGVRVPGSVVPCGNCHGRDGLGRAEGGVLAPSIVWADLSASYGHIHANGRRHRAFDEAGFIRAVREGVDPTGNRLDPAMPRFSISGEDARSLIAYLKEIETDLDPGLAEDEIGVATVIPAEGPLRAVGAAVARVLRGYFDDVNAAGGIYGRRIVLREVGFGRDPGAIDGALRGLAAREDVFAVVAPVALGGSAFSFAVFEQARVPVVGPISASMHSEEDAGPYVFFLDAGIDDLVRVSIRFLRGAAAAPRVAVLAPENGPLARAAGLALREVREAKQVTYPADRFDAPAAVAALRDQSIDTVLFFGADAELSALLKAADAAGWHPQIHLPGNLAARAAAAAPAGFDGRVYLAFPTLPCDLSEQGLSELNAFSRRHRIEDDFHSVRVASYVAAKVFVEALRRAGRSLSRAGLKASLEGLHDFRTGLTPPLGFNADKRVGARGGYVVSTDAARHSFRPQSEWIRLEP